MNRTIRVIGPKIKSQGKNIIRIPNRNRKPATARNHENTPTSAKSARGLVIVIPPKRATKRAHEVDSEEDNMLVVHEERPPKRARKVVAFNSSNYEVSKRKPITTSTLQSTTTPNLPPIIPATPTPPCSYIGSFDVYAMDHQDLCQIYWPEGSKEAQYESLYHALRSESTTEKLTARISLPTTPYGRKFGSALVPVLCDPVSERPYEIELTRISHVSQVFYRDHERECFVTRHNSDVSRAGKVPGVSGKTGVSASRAKEDGVLESAGNFNLSCVWEKVDEDGRVMQVFEGYMSLRVRYSKDYREKGYGDGFDIGFAFWAIRTNDAG
ncbi:hypothetical protein FB446DRAFT_705888 [Lentinula raphanica]|nr:hypothetical protein FB446DRAFT_705888 [Lentinula raphanica]